MNSSMSFDKCAERARRSLESRGQRVFRVPPSTRTFRGSLLAQRCAKRSTFFNSRWKLWWRNASGVAARFGEERGREILARGIDDRELDVLTALSADWPNLALTE